MVDLLLTEWLLMVGWPASYRVALNGLPASYRVALNG